MAVAKKQGKEKPVKIVQRKVWGLQWGPQTKQTALLASPIYIGQAQGKERKTYKKRSQNWARACLLFSLHLLGQPTLTHRGCIFLCLPIKLSCNTAVTLVHPRKLHRAVTLVHTLVQIFVAMRQPRKLHTPKTSSYRYIKANQKFCFSSDENS